MDFLNQNQNQNDDQNDEEKDEEIEDFSLEEEGEANIEMPAPEDNFKNNSPEEEKGVVWQGSDLPPIFADNNNVETNVETNGRSSDGGSSPEKNNFLPEISESVETNSSSSDRSSDDKVQIPQFRAAAALSMLKNMREEIDKLIDVLNLSSADSRVETIKNSQLGEDFGINKAEVKDEDVKVIEGIFDGEKMISDEGKQYNVSANYASKSKLVEGDRLKLKIMPNGAFVYKQIGPIERKRLSGQLKCEASGDFYVEVDEKRWKVLPASVTYFRGAAGDNATILIPKSHPSRFAAVENIILDLENRLPA